MALTGALNAIDRALIEPNHDIVIHGSGWYTTADYVPQCGGTTAVTTTAEIAQAISGAEPR